MGGRLVSALRGLTQAGEHRLVFTRPNPLTAFPIGQRRRDRGRRGKGERMAPLHLRERSDDCPQGRRTKLARMPKLKRCLSYTILGYLRSSARICVHRRFVTCSAFIGISELPRRARSGIMGDGARLGRCARGGEWGPVVLAVFKTVARRWTRRGWVRLPCTPATTHHPAILPVPHGRRSAGGASLRRSAGGVRTADERR